MELLLTVTAGTNRRLTGTARRHDREAVVAFSGSLELLACLEQLCQDEPIAPSAPSTDPSPVNEDR